MTLVVSVGGKGILKMSGENQRNNPLTDAKMKGFKVSSDEAVPAYGLVGIRRIASTSWIQAFTGNVGT